MSPAAAARWTEPRRDDDARLVSDLISGDEDAFLRLVHREHASMIRYARLFVSAPASAEEVVQEAWVGMLVGLARFEGRSSLRSWMLGIVANREVVRRSRGSIGPRLGADGRPRGGRNGSGSLLPPGLAANRSLDAATEPWPDDCLERAETVQLVREAIERLPGLRRQVILLRDVEGWSAEEVCALLGITEGNQRVLLHRARSLIRVGLERHFRDCNVRAPAPTPWRYLGLSGHGSFQ